MAATTLYQIVLLCGFMLLAFGYPTNDILFGDENDAVLEKYLKYLQRVPDKWQDFYEGDDDNDVAVDDEEDSNEMEEEEEESYSESEAESEADYQSFRFSNSDQAEEWNYYEGDEEEEGDEDDSSEEIEEMEDMIPDKDGFDVELMMPEVSPEDDDTYLCHVMPMPKELPVYIVGYEPHAESEVAHHVLLYGCKLPGDFDTVWNCGEMAGSGARPVCMGEQKILYAWALDAPALELPEDVGFKVGGDSDIDYLVLQIHYKSAEPFKDGSTDSSGMTMHMTLERQRLVAGVYFMGADGKIPGHQETKLEGACMYAEKPTMHPFAYRVHTHTLGKVVSAYRIRDNDWEEIGKRDPQLPEMFYPVTDIEMTIEKGDILAMRCTMESDRDRTTYIGSTKDDEMCNFYIMYYTDEDQDLPKENSCYKFDFEWSNYLKNIPDEEASTLPLNQPPPMKMEGMDMGKVDNVDVSEPVVQEVVVPPKMEAGEEEEEEEEDVEEDEEDAVEEDENDEEDPDPRK